MRRPRTSRRAGIGTAQPRIGRRIALLAVVGIGAAAGITAAPVTMAQADTAASANCPAPSGGGMQCFSESEPDPTTVALAPGASPAGWGPADLQQAYSLPVTTGGAGQTVAVVDPFIDRNAESDLAVYRSQFGLPACTTANGCFKAVTAPDQTVLSTANPGWTAEISLDLDMVSAACPLCHIVLMETQSNDDGLLEDGVNQAASMAKVVSMSWGDNESSGETGNDGVFAHKGVAFIASTGDSGYPGGAQYPATSPYVTAAGGTVLTRDASTTRGFTEAAWSGAGTGCSLYENIPSWQQGIYTGPLCSMRAEADVAAVAQGVAVYNTNNGNVTNGGWHVESGTSVSAPLIAGVYALAGGPGPNDNPSSYPYRRGTASNLFDTASGQNGSCGIPTCTSGTGWDGPTGLGTPHGVGAFSSLTVTPPTNTFISKGVAVTISPARSGGMAPFTWTFVGLPAGLSGNTSTGVITGAPTTTGSYSVRATATDADGVFASAIFGLTVGVAVPNVLSFDTVSAENAITAAGLAYTTSTLNNCIDAGTVQTQTPTGGATATPGSTVSLKISTCTSTGGPGGGNPILPK